MQTKKELGIILAEHLSKNEEFGECIKVLKENSHGTIWLIGGTVYRTLAYILYGYESFNKDFDFIVEHIKNPLTLARGWEKLQTRFGNPRLKKGGIILDMIPLGNIHSIYRRNLVPNIKNFLTGTPLTIQSIAFDIDKKEIVGEIGLRSLFNKTIGINDQEEFKYSYGDISSIEKYVENSGFTLMGKN